MWKVAIDPGHSGTPDPGALGQKYTESQLAFAIGLRVAQRLDKTHLYECMLTKNDEKDPESDELSVRTEAANRFGADLFVSIHLNGSENPEATGTETFYFRDDEASKVLAGLIQEEVVFATGLYNRGVKPAGFYVLANTNMTAVLVEVGFITNPDDEALIVQKLDQIADAIAHGIRRYMDT